MINVLDGYLTIFTVLMMMNLALYPRELYEMMIFRNIGIYEFLLVAGTWVSLVVLVIRIASLCN